MRTLYLTMIDEEALAGLVALRRVGTWEGELPYGEVSPDIAPTLADGCAVTQAKGSLAGYAALEGLQEVVPFEDGDFADGTQHLPVAAFYPRLYDEVTKRLAQLIGGYNQVVARIFERGKPQRPRSNVGRFPVEVHAERGILCGHVGDEAVIWEVGERETEEEAPGVAVEYAVPEWWPDDTASIESD